MTVTFLRVYRKTSIAAILWTLLAGYFVVSTLANPYSQPLCVGTDPAANCRAYLLPAEQIAYDNYQSGKWSEDNALDYLASQSAMPVPVTTTVILWAVGILVIGGVWAAARRRRPTTDPSAGAAPGAQWAAPAADDRPFLERLPQSIRRPSVLGLVIAWVVAVLTWVIYPVAIYMSWRYYAEWRNAASKVCPRCAERVKSAAMVCRHCGQELDHAATQAAASS